jgi:hypothetical protein
MVAEVTAKELHANSKIEEVSLKKLQVDFSYQRDPSETLVDSIAEDWDTVASELILVSDRGTRSNDGEVKGGLFIVNGQHRSKAAQKRGMDNIWARVIDLRKVADPGAIEAGFRLKTNVRLGDRPLERFKAQIRSGNEESLAIEKLLERFNTEINVQPQQEIGINCVATIEALYRLDDGSLLGDTLEVVRDTWGYAGGRNAHAAILKGICWFIEKHADESDRTRLVSKMKGVGMAALESRARTTGLTMGGSLWINYYRALVELYNEQLRDKNRLQWKLRGSRNLEGRGGGGARTTPTN